MKKQSFITHLIIFSLCFCFLFSSVPVCASNLQQSGLPSERYREPSGWDDWSDDDRMYWISQFGLPQIISALGLFIDPSSGNIKDYFETFLTFEYEKILAENSISWHDYITSHFEVDEDGTGVTVSSEFINNFRDYLLEILKKLDKESGYITYQTFGVNEIPDKWFNHMIGYNFVTTQYDLYLSEGGAFDVSTGEFTPVKKVNDAFIFTSPYIKTTPSTNPQTFSVTPFSISDYFFVIDKNIKIAGLYGIQVFNRNYERLKGDFNGMPLFNYEMTSSMTQLREVTQYSQPYTAFATDMKRVDYRFGPVITPKRTTIKLFNSIEDMKAYDVNDLPYYKTSAFDNYNPAADNSVYMNEETYTSMDDYRTNCDNIYNYFTENNVDNGISDGALALIIEEILAANNNNGGSGPVDPGNSGSGGSGSSGGSGLFDLIEGIGKLLDFILSLVGKLVGLISDFLTNVLSMLGNFTVFTDGFGEFLTEAFGFLPPEAIASISLGVTVIVVLAIIKFLKG